MKPSREKVPELVSDLKGGEIVRLDAGVFRIIGGEGGDAERPAGLYRVTHMRPFDGGRTAIPLTDNLREMRGHVEVAGRTRVLEVLLGHREAKVAKDEIDPMLGGGRR